MRLYRFFFPHQTEENRAILREYDKEAASFPLPAQGHPMFRRLFYGVKPMSYNGCEVIACCHALRYFDRPCKLADTAAFCADAGLWLWGLFGTHPHALYTFCRSFGFAFHRYAIHRLPDVIAEDCILYSYWNPRLRGIHTVCLYREKKSGLFIVTNHSGLRDRRFPAAADALRAIPTAAPIVCLGIKSM